MKLGGRIFLKLAVLGLALVGGSARALAEDPPQAAVTFKTEPFTTTEGSYNSMNKRGEGFGGSVVIGPPRYKFSISDGNLLDDTAELIEGPQVKSQFQLGRDEKGQVTLPRGNLEYNYIHGTEATVNVAGEIASAGHTEFVGIGLDRNMAMDRAGRFTAKYGATRSRGNNLLRFEGLGQIEAGVGRTGRLTLPFAMGRAGLTAEVCPIGDSDRNNQLCLKNVVTLAAGLLAFEGTGSADLEYRHWSTRNKTKLTVGAGVEGAFGGDFGGIHSFDQARVKAAYSF